MFVKWKRRKNNENENKFKVHEYFCKGTVTATTATESLFVHKLHESHALSVVLKQPNSAEIQPHAAFPLSFSDIFNRSEDEKCRLQHHRAAETGKRKKDENRQTPAACRSIKLKKKKKTHPAGESAHSPSLLKFSLKSLRKSQGGTCSGMQHLFWRNY